MSDDEIFDPLAYPTPTSAIDELKKIHQWVSWKYVKRGTGKPTKPPVNPNNGRIADITEPTNWASYERACWRTKASDLAGVGFVLSETDDYTGIDLDACVNANTGKIEPWAIEILDIAETYAEFSPSGTGIRMFVRGKIEKSTKCDVAHVEIYRSDRYLTVTGKHIDDTPDDIQPAPKTIAALLARCDAMRPKDEPELDRTGHENAPPQRFVSNDAGSHAWAKVALEKRAERLAGTGEGGRNTALNATAYGMGRIVARGWIDESTVRAALEDACKANGVWKDDGPKQCRQSLNSGLSKGKQNPRPDLPEREEDREIELLADDIGRRVDEAYASRKIEEAEDGTLYDAQTGEVINTAKPTDVSFPEELTHAPGLIGEITEWILATSRRPHRALALATAVATVGTVCGYWAGPTNAATNLYVVMLAPTGSGKDHFIRSPAKLLSEAGLEMLVGPKKFMSQTAVQSHVMMSPVSICPQDEFGGTLCKITSKRASSFEGSISEELRELWGINFKMTSTSARASAKGETLYAICLSILGASTAEEFWKAMQGGDVLNGFLNRFLMFPMDYLPKVVKPKIDDLEEAPAHILSGLRSLHCGGYGLDTDQSKDCLATNATTKTWKPVVVRWASKEAEDMWYEYEANISEKHGQVGDSTRMAYYARTAQNAIRLATILALGKLNDIPLVSVDDVRWGIDVAEWSARAMMQGAGLHIAESDHQTHSNRITRIVTKNGGEATWRQIHQGFNNSVPTRIIKEAIETMIEGGYIIEIVDPPKSKGGHRVKRYRLGVAND